MSFPILILLAGGKSTRMGSPKGLLNYNGTPWILEQIHRYKKVVNNPIVYIALGYDFKKYFNAISWLKKAINNSYNYDGVEVKVVLNKQPHYGAFSTLQTVLNLIERENTVIVQPIDVPLANKESLTAIITKKNTIIIPVCNGKNGHPVKLEPEFWSTLLSLNKSSENARLDTQIKQLHPSSISYLNVMDTSVYQNINTLNDWNNYLDSNKE